MFASKDRVGSRLDAPDQGGRVAFAFAAFLAATVIIAALWSIPGCLFGAKPVTGGADAEPDGEPAALEPSTPANPSGGAPSVFERPLQKLVVEFKVHRFSAPAGTFSGDEHVWRLVTGRLSDAASALRLADNGFRAAVGQESDRAALRQYLDGLQGIRSAVDTATPDASRMVDLEVGTCRPQLTVFYYDRQGRLHGLDFERAKARFKLAFEMRSANLREVWLEVVPEIEEPPGPPKWIITDQGAQQQPEERRRTFSELAFSAQVPEGGFLLVGPAKAVGGRPLLAMPFLTEERPGREEGVRDTWESVYVISPIIRSTTQGG